MTRFYQLKWVSSNRDVTETLGREGYLFLSGIIHTFRHSGRQQMAIPIITAVIVIVTLSLIVFPVSGLVWKALDEKNRSADGKQRETTLW